MLFKKEMCIKMKKTIIILSLILLTSKLFGTPYWLKEPDFSDYMKSWLGINADELIKTWGPMNAITELSDSSKVLKYEKTVVDITDPTYIQGTVKTYTKTDKIGRTYTETEDSSYYNPGSRDEYYGYVLFTIDSDNIIIDYNYHGQKGALWELIKESTSPYFNRNDFYLTQYNEKAKEWIGEPVDNVKIICDYRNTKKKNNYIELIERNDVSDSPAFVCYPYPAKDSNSCICFLYNYENREITEVKISGNYIDFEKSYFSPSEMPKPKDYDSGAYYALGFTLGKDNAFGIHSGLVVNDSGVSFGTIAWQFDIYIASDIFDINCNIVTLTLDLVDEKDFKIYLGAGCDLGWNFRSKNHGFNLGFPLSLGTKIGPIDINGIVRPGFFTDDKLFWKIQVSYLFSMFQ